MINDLVQKYNVQGPRYTSFPTVPNWDHERFNVDAFQKAVQFQFKETNDSQGLALYIHLPFCESLCTFCACHKYITKRHEQEIPYIEAVIKEWDMYIQLFAKASNSKPILRELHLGGGTPTFFAPQNLEYLLTSIYKKVKLAPDFEGSFEGHPESTSTQHLSTLHKFGFTRLSIGVQDYNIKVQQAIHRMQSFDQVAQVHLEALQLGYTSISQDLVYGLPFQSLEDLQYTIERTLELKPDRIAFYSYAHVPWIKGLGQRGFSEEDLPTPDLKLEMLTFATQALLQAGYVAIGMDHFALPTDSMAKAIDNQALHRNFMGYTVSNTKLMIGLGMSSISDSWTAFGQNEKSLKDYLQLIEKGQLPIVKGHILTSNDSQLRDMILSLMCHFETTDFHTNLINPSQLSMFEELIKDQMIEVKNNQLLVLAKGRNFVRNVAMTIDPYLTQTSINQYSKTI